MGEAIILWLQKCPLTFNANRCRNIYIDSIAFVTWFVSETTGDDALHVGTRGKEEMEGTGDYHSLVVFFSFFFLNTKQCVLGTK